MSGSNGCFLTCIQICQEADQEVWYSHLLKNFLQFAVIHKVQGFDVVNEAEVDVFQEPCCFFDVPMNVDQARVAVTAHKPSREELPHLQGAVPMRAQEGLEELLQVQGQEGQR